MAILFSVALTTGYIEIIKFPAGIWFALMVTLWNEMAEAKGNER